METSELLEVILKEMVSKPDEVSVVRSTDEMGVLLTVKLGDGDAGMVIGKEGRTIQAIRSILMAVGSKNRERINIKLDVPERGKRDEGQGEQRPPEKKKDILEDLK